MSELQPPSRAFLREIGVQPSKGRGQNFLKEQWVVDRMAAELEVGSGELVIEVGPGLGALTSALLDTGATVRAVEIDENLAAYLERALDSGRFSVVRADARAVSIDEIVPAGRKYAFAANLPYSSAPVILRHFLESERPPERSICMVQREVALRIAADPPEMSILGVAIQVYAKARLLFDVPPDAFVPRPRVVSSVVLLEQRTEPLISVGERAAFFRLVNAGFAQKRKTVLNSLTAALPCDRDALRQALERAGIDPMRRAETIAVPEWIDLLHMLALP